MSAATFRNEERIGLIVAIAAHAALFAWLALWRPVAEPVEPPESISVTLSDEVGLVATTPNPSADPAPDSAPMVGDSPPPPAPEPLPQPEVRPLAPAAREVPAPKPVTRPTQPRRDPIADLLDRRPVTKPTPRPAAKPTTGPSGRPAGKPGASSWDQAYGKGIPGASGTGGPPAQPGPQDISTMQAQINRQLIGPWKSCVPDGLDVTKLRVTVTFTLDQQGKVISASAATPTGINDANRAQSARFRECAEQAVYKVRQFKLPPEYYDYWKTYRRTFRRDP